MNATAQISKTYKRIPAHQIQVGNVFTCDFTIEPETGKVTNRRAKTVEMVTLVTGTEKLISSIEDSGIKLHFDGGISMFEATALVEVLVK